jgi:hypothetical protein
VKPRIRAGNHGEHPGRSLSPPRSASGAAVSTGDDSTSSVERAGRLPELVHGYIHALFTLVGQRECYGVIQEAFGSLYAKA